MAICKHEKCPDKAGFGDIQNKKPLYCIKHKLPHHIGVMNKFCQGENCITTAHFGDPEDRKAIFCASCKPDHYINVKNKKCLFKNCPKQAGYGDKMDKIPLYCVEHKLIEHISVKYKSCLIENCPKRPSYGDIKNKVPIYCLEHKLDHHVNVTSKKCLFENCPKKACYGDKIALYCSEHKLDHHIDISNKKCQKEGCPKRASYGDPQNKILIFCSEHKPDHYVNLVNKKCWCGKICLFGDIKDKIPLYCVEHKLSYHIDVKHRLCDFENCPLRPKNGFPGFILTRCNRHVLSAQIKRSKSKCKIKNCIRNATYGFDFPIHCEEHRLYEHKDLVNRNCKNCNLPNILNQDMLCEYCNPETIKKMRLRKQNEIKDFLDSHLPEHIKYISTDRTINNAECGKERPDFLFDFGHFICVLEVDEHQHKDRNCECETVRMINIHNSLGIKTLFIRYNPDNYKNKSIYKYAKNEERKNNLLNLILYWEQNFEKLKHECSIIYLYFDNDDPLEWYEPIALSY